MDKKQPTNKRPPLSPLANLVLAGAALGFSYAAISAAIDTGSLLVYAAALVLFGLSIRNIVLAYQGHRKKQ